MEPPQAPTFCSVSDPHIFLALHKSIMDRGEHSPVRDSAGRADEDNGVKLFVGGLPWSLQDQDLEDAFKEFGEITFCRVMIDRYSGRSRGFGFVTFAKEEDANKAVEEMHDSELGGRTISCNKARAKGEGGRRNDRDGGKDLLIS